MNWSNVLFVLMEVRIELGAYQGCVFTSLFHEQIECLVLLPCLKMRGNRDSPSHGRGNQDPTKDGNFLHLLKVRPV